MSSIPTKHIDGDVAIGRNVSVGGDANVQGSARIGHDLKVEGWLEAKNIKGVNKGLFASAAALREAYPQPHDGWFAGVSASEADITALGLTVQQGKALFRMYVGSGGDWVCEPINKLYEIVVDNVQVNNLREDLSTLQGKHEALEKRVDAHDTEISDVKNLTGDVLALQQAVWPLDVKLSVSPDVIEVGKTTNVTASWTARRNGVNILPQSELSINDGSTTTTLAQGTSSKSLIMAPAAPVTVTCRLTVSYQQMTREATAQIRAVHPSYFGKIAADAAVNAAVVTALTKVLNASRSMTQSGIALANQRICFAYPKSLGTLTSVKDGNNFEMLTAYTRTEVTISGVAYYVYTMTEPVTASGVKQIYS